MQTEKIASTDVEWNFTQKLADYIQLGKLRLSLVVVFSAGISFLIGLNTPIDWSAFIGLLLGGLAITLSANAINEILEKKYDALMKRTSIRPLPAGRMEKGEAIVFVLISGILGIGTMWLAVNFLAALLSVLSLALYSFVYTPLKRITFFSVFVGAIPGALPTLIGWAAATGTIGVGGWALFVLQFLWQLPHFWSIAWLGFDDYARAGYRLMPFGGEKDRKSAWQILLYTLLLIPASFLPYYFGITSYSSAIILMVLAFLFCLPGIMLIKKLNRRWALLIMFGSFLYLPIAQLAILLYKI
jgi:protoheme IX farnesyltransferase